MQRLFLAFLASALTSGVWAGEPTVPAKKAPEPVKLTASQMDRVSAGGALAVSRYDTATSASYQKTPSTYFVGFVGPWGGASTIFSGGGLHSGQIGSGGRSYSTHSGQMGTDGRISATAYGYSGGGGRTGMAGSGG